MFLAAANVFEDGIKSHAVPTERLERNYTLFKTRTVSNNGSCILEVETAKVQVESLKIKSDSLAAGTLPAKMEYQNSGTEETPKVQTQTQLPKLKSVYPQSASKTPTPENHYSAAATLHDGKLTESDDGNQNVDPGLEPISDHEPLAVDPQCACILSII